MKKSMVMKIKKIFQNKTVKNAKWMIAEQLVQMLISLILGVITTRYLGPANYGIINYCAAFVAFFSSLCTLGLEGIIIKELVNHREKEGEIIGTGLGLRLISGTLSIIAILIVLVFMNPGDALVLKIAFLQSLVIVFRAFDLIDYWFQSYLQSKYVAIIKSITYILVAFYKGFILITNKSVEWFAFSTSLDYLLIAIMISVAYYKKGGMRLSFSFKRAENLLSQSYHFILSGLIVTIYSQMDKIMIGKMLNEEQVGFYSAALMICNYWILIPLAIINSARPTIMEEKKRGNNELYIKRIKQLYFVLIWSGIIVSSVISMLSPIILQILYKEAYKSAATSLTIAIWYTTFSVLGTARGIWIVCENKNAYVKKYVFWGAIINFGLNYVLIPILGINGAAIATLITQIFTCLFAPVLYKNTRIHTKYVIQAFIGKGIR